MWEQVQTYMECYNMVKAGDRIIAAVSGGGDSVCLLHLLSCMKRTHQFELCCLHVHHGIRGAEADRDAAFVESLAAKLSIPCQVVYCDAVAYAAKEGMSLEEAARTLRYGIFEKEAAKAVDQDVRIAVAHHRDDNAETILHNLFRGSGLRGLSGIRPVRERIIRPLLEVSHQEILDYLEKHKLTCCQDSTNLSLEYTRNRLRHEVLPLITEAVNKEAVSHILCASRLLLEADGYLEQTASSFVEAYCVRDMNEEKIEIPIECIRKEAPIIQSYIIGLMLDAICNSRKNITAKHIEQIRDLIGKPVGKYVTLPQGRAARRTYETLCLERAYRKKTEKSIEYELPIPVYSRISYEKGKEFPQKEYTKWFDYDRIKGTLSVRFRETGDYILLPSGGKKTIKTYMIDQKIPKEQREHIPLLAEGNHILWMIGYRISEYYKVTEETTEILQVQFNGGNVNGG